MLWGWEHATEGRGCLELPCTDIVLSYAALDARGIKVSFALEGYGDQSSVWEVIKDLVKSQMQNGQEVVPWTSSELLARIV